ncbi:MAG: IMPACT family protein [Halanaerobiales bacterium]
MKKIICTPAQEIEILNKVKDSKFYGNIKSVDNENKVNKFIQKIKNKYYDASHNVSAYKLGIGDSALKYSDDDGEPAGSSGPPVLEVIEGKSLTNTVIVITRYFGGTKLGIGGLIRAYGNTARMVIEESGIKKLKLVYTISLKGKYEIIGNIMGQIESFNGKILSTDYDNKGGTINAVIKPTNYKKLKNKLIEITGNKVEFNINKKQYI